MNALIIDFLTEHGSEDMVEMWQGDYQEKLMKLFPKKAKKATSPKDPNKPKRGKSAYLFFCADNRAKTKEDLGDDAKATEVTKELGRLWNELKESDKKSDKKKMEKYEKQAAEDKERYEAEMVDYEPPSEEELEEMMEKKKSKKSSGKKDPNKPKRGKSAYLFFCADNRTKTKEDLGDDAKATEVTAELGRLWNELKESDKKSDKKKMEKYEKQAAEDKERYEAEMVDYEPPSEEDESEKKPAKKPSAKKPSAKKPAKKEDLEESEEEPVEEKKSDKKKSDKKSDKKMTGYSLFCKEYREDVKEENPDAKGSEITKILAGMWKELGQDEKDEWKVKAADQNA